MPVVIAALLTFSAFSTSAKTRDNAARAANPVAHVSPTLARGRCRGRVRSCAHPRAAAGHGRTVRHPATTTSTQDTGLLDVLVPAFETSSGFRSRPLPLGPEPRSHG